MNKKTLTIFAGMMLLARALPGQGQDAFIPTEKHAAALELNLIQSVWYNSDNAAGMTIDTLKDYNTVSGAYRHVSGDYKSLQRGDRETSETFNTNGARRIGKISLWGDFTFRNEYWTGTQYNTNRFFPSLDMPYYVADPNKGDWNKQLYDMTVKAAFPLFWNTLALGGRINYTAYKGAKQIDPRGVPIGYGIEVEPAVLVRITGHHALGATFRYRNGFERNTFSNVQGGSSSIVYLMKGLGTFSSGAVSGTSGIGNYYYPANTFGGTLQYSYFGQDFKILAEGGYSSETVEAFQNPTIAYRMGTTESSEITAGLRMVWGKKNLHNVSADFSMTDIKGIEYLQERTSGQDENDPYTILATLDMSHYSHTEASAAYDFFLRRTSAADYTWNFGIDLCYMSRADQYNTPLSVFNYQNAEAALHAKRNIVIKGRHRLAFKAEGGYRYNLSGEYEYNGADAGHRVVTEFYTSEHAFYSASFARIGWSAGYSYSFRKSSLCLDLEGDHIMTDDSRSRTFLGACVSYVF